MGRHVKNLEKKGLEEAAERLGEHIGENAELLRAEHTLPAVGMYVDYFYDEKWKKVDFSPYTRFLSKKDREIFVCLMFFIIFVIAVSKEI